VTTDYKIGTGRASPKDYTAKYINNNNSPNLLQNMHSINQGVSNNLRMQQTNYKK